MDLREHLDQAIVFSIVTALFVLFWLHVGNYTFNKFNQPSIANVFWPNQAVAA